MYICRILFSRLVLYLQDLRKNSLKLLSLCAKAHAARKSCGQAAPTRSVGFALTCPLRPLRFVFS